MDEQLREFGGRVRSVGVREAGRRLNVSGSHVCNIIKGRRWLMPALLDRARATLAPTWGRGYVRVLSAAEYERIHGGPYPIPEEVDDDGW